MQEPQLFKCLHPVIKLLASHSGRDKVAKTLHYASRILIWHHTNRGDTARANEVETFRQAIGNSRRVGRFLSSVNAIPTVWRLIFPDPRSKEPNKIFRALLLIANVSDMFYYVSDNLTYAAKYGFIKMSPKTVYFWEELVGSWSWLISVLIYIAYDYATWLKLKNQRIRLERTIASDPSIKANHSALAATDEELYNMKLNFVKNLADLQLAIFFCFPNSTWPSHWVGLFGVTNALTGGYQMLRGYYKSAA